MSARVITTVSGKAVEQIFSAIGMDGCFVLVGAIMEPISINTLPTLSQNLSNFGPVEILKILRIL
jgi:hypothetical protein